LILIINNTGDDRLRQRDSRVRPFLFGMASVPDTHLMHPLIAEDSVIGKAMARMQFAFAPALAV